ncbi:MAG: VWA domain-containing protein [Bacteroidetes bacterium]|nr:MAG: VWA domain-containing protein [Bacteroidota bacterium]MBL1145290.1 VWA domain-containing protein [Bacteroidota bacterium]NOG58087.1 VWA domain-containing protein [Bacteroidota bacterium]
MFRFEHTGVLWGLVLIPIMMLLFFFVKKWRAKARQRFADPELLNHIMPRYSNLKFRLKFIFFLIGYTLLVIGIANPQLGTKLEEVKREGIDLIVAIDVSNSMKAEDLSPNRLERAKRAMLQLVGDLKSDRLGIIVFAGQAYTQLPITTDYAAAKLFLGTIDTDMIPTQGTAIGAAIDLAIESFDYEQGGNKALIIVTDGENHEDDAIASAEEALKKGIKVFTIGMGTPNGAPIPVFKRGKQIGYRQDNSGNTIVSSLNEQMLGEIAASGDGMYIRATNANAGFDQILDELSGLEKSEYESQVYTDYEDRFQFFIGASLLFLILSIILSERKSKISEKVNLFDI